MLNFTIIVFVFFLVLLGLSFIVLDQLLLFFVVFLALVIAFVSLLQYLGRLKGFVIFIGFIILPFVIEYLLHKLNLPLFETATLNNLSLKEVDMPITISNLFLISSLPMIFVTSLIFAKKLKLITKIIHRHKTFLVILSSILVALNFITLQDGQILWLVVLKWLIIALLVNLIIAKLFTFKAGVSDLYKEIPVIVFLAFLVNKVILQPEAINLIFLIILLVLYLYVLYKEYKLKKISASIVEF